jgi:hypothetical protein
MNQNNNNTAGCLTALVSSFSRIMLLMYWISRPVAWNAAFSGFLLPCLGFMFLPITTMVYVWLIQGVGNSIQGLDWLWLILAVVMDFATIGSAGYSNRNRLPAGVPGATTPPPSAPPSAPAQ